MVPLLVLSTSGLITLRSWQTTERTIDAVSGEIFAQVTRDAAARTRAHLGAAVPALAFLSRLERRAVRVGDESVLPRLLSMLEANPGFSWVSYGDVDGSFGAAYRPEPGRVRLNWSHIVLGHTILDEVDLDSAHARVPFRHDDDSGYDPRTRPWYRAAAESGRRVWLPPYVFFHQGIPGITCAEPQLGEHGEIAGVYTIDFDLGALSRFVAELEPSAHGQAFLFTPDGELLAHPTHATVTATAGSEDGRIAMLADLEDPTMRGFRGALEAASLGADDAVAHELGFTVAGAPWRARVESFEVDEGLRWRVAAIAPESDFLPELQAENRTSVAIGLGALALAVLAALLLAGRIARPLAELAAQMEAVGRFEVDDRPPPRSFFSEIDAMSTALGRMKSGLSSFARFVPRDLVRTLIATGREARLGGELRTLSVFFSDLAGFTTLAESVPPDELVRKLGGYLDRMTRTITEGRGTVDKYLGDGIMAFWGAPLDDAAHARGAAETALRCQRALAALANEAGSEWIGTTATRIGIATGEVVVGNVGTPERLNYTVMGDTANLAARLESLSKQYGTLVLCDEPTLRGAEGHVVGRPLDVVAVKGKARGVRIYELLALADDDAETVAEARAVAEKAETALAAYLGREFERAAALYAELESMRAGGDVAARTMRERAERYAQTPPPADWNGVHVAKDK